MNVSSVVSELSSKATDAHWRRERVAQHIDGRLSRLLWADSGTPVTDLPWANLIILDACRADIWQAAAPEVGERTTTITSVASATCEWTERTWNGDHSDITYVTANPVVDRHCDRSVFDRFVPAYQQARGTFLHAEDLVPIATKAAGDADRLVAHFIEPHGPFHSVDWFSHEYDTVWRALRDGAVSHERVREAYIEHLEYGLMHALRLADDLPGATVITSDHGNLMGERVIGRRQYGHPRGMRHEDLLTVPWAVVDGDDRLLPSDTETQLEALGYR